MHRHLGSTLCAAPEEVARCAEGLHVLLVQNAVGRRVRLVRKGQLAEHAALVVDLQRFFSGAVLIEKRRNIVQ